MKSVWRRLVALPVFVLTMFAASVGLYAADCYDTPFWQDLHYMEDGFAHIRIQLNGGAESGDVRARVDEALARLNSSAISSITHVKFDIVTSAPDLSINLADFDATELGGQLCGIHDGGDTIYLSRNDAGTGFVGVEGAAGSGNETVRNNVATLIMHEIGHYLALDQDPGGRSTIMGSHASGTDCSDAMDSTSYPEGGFTTDDANAVLGCINDRSHNFLQGEADEDPRWDRCEIWFVTRVYLCDGDPWHAGTSCSLEDVVYHYPVGTIPDCVPEI